MAPKDRVKYTRRVGTGEVRWPHSQNDSLHVSGNVQKSPADCPPTSFLQLPRGHGMPSSAPHASVPCYRAATQAAISQPSWASWELLLELEGAFSLPLLV